MMQMRWYLPAGSKTAVLQYRQIEDKTIYAGIAPMLPPVGAIVQWSDWTHVQLVTEMNLDKLEITE
jgi:hypothetical protein